MENSLDNILTDYKTINLVEKTQLLLKKGSIPYKGINNEIWYSVQLSNSKENNGKDVAVYREENGNYIIDVFENVSGCGKQYQLIGKGGGQEYSTPYFVNWDGQNFMVVPYWNETNERVVGMSIYDFTSRYTVLTIGIQDNSKVVLSGQMYESYGATEYPQIYWSK